MDGLHEIEWALHREIIGEPMLRRCTEDGRPAYLLYGRQLIITEPSVLR